IQTPAGQIKLQTLLQDVQASCDFILLDTESHYPSQLLPYADRPPILFGQGNPQSLLQPQVAIVGSRKPSPHGKQVAYDFAYYLAEKGFYICSGLAEGIDAAAHQGGLKYQRTIAVMGTGLDLTYPSQHQALRTQILENNGCIITEFLPHTPPLQHNFPRRNRIVSALSLGVVVAEAALKSGSLGTAKSAAEQGKIIFAIPGHIYSEHHQGCHQLIREGAILVDHPEQIIEDLALPTQWHSQSQSQETAPSASIEIPSDLLKLYNQLDWVGQNMDQLNFKLNTDIATLTSQLMELEILGLAQQQAGNYLRCRSSQ
ncbi:MAG: DNA-processing protein DprA, partial [Pseudomonadales bacterium]|nr:DNA-processing protein DprA [Pseudomonadales bacterium]